MPGVPHWNLEHEASLIEEPSFFENTYKPNQHMTFNGSLVATGMIADSLRRMFGDLLPRRDTLPTWHDRFRGAGGYYAFQAIREDEEIARVWAADARFEAHHVIDILSFPHENDDYQIVQVRFDATPLGATPLPDILRSQWSFQAPDSSVKSAIVELRFDSLRSRSERLIYRNIIRGDVELLALQGIAR